MSQSRITRAISRVGVVASMALAVSALAGPLAWADEASEIDDIYRSEIRSASDRILELDSALQLRDMEIADLRKKIRGMFEKAQKLSQLPGAKPSIRATHEMTQATNRFSELVQDQNAQIARKTGLEKRREVFERLRKKGVFTSKQVVERLNDLQEEQARVNVALQDVQARQHAIMTDNSIDWSTPESSQEAYRNLEQALEAISAEINETNARYNENNEEVSILSGLSLLAYASSPQGRNIVLDPNALLELLDKGYGYRPLDAPCDMSCYAGASSSGSSAGGTVGIGQWGGMGFSGGGGRF